jgi:myo-inositol 2-dehydrogenase / D-chiro-inositol 1-dehydrogenase
MRIGVIGAGRMGGLHARALRLLPDVSEVLIADIDPARARETALHEGCTAVADVDALWGKRPRGVVIAASTKMHATLIRRAVRERAGILCEKPLTTTMDESIEIADLVRDAGVPLMVGFQRRFDRAFQDLRAEMNRRAGAGFVLRIRHADTAPPPAGYLATAPGSMFVDMCIHDYDTIRWLSGSEVAAVSSAGAVLTGLPDFGLHDDVDTVVSTIHLENGSVGVLEAFRHSRDGYVVSGEMIGADADAATPAGKRCDSWYERFCEAFQEEARTFVSSLAGGHHGEAAGALDATRALQVALAAETAFRERRTVALEPVRA